MVTLVPNWTVLSSQNRSRSHFPWMQKNIGASRLRCPCDPWKQIPASTKTEFYGTTGELLARIKVAIAERAHLSDKNRAVLMFWVFSTWFEDVLPLAPGLAMTGWAHEEDLVLRTLRALCYHPVLVAGMTSAILNNCYGELKPTSLLSEPALSRRMAVLLGKLHQPRIPGAHQG